MEEHFEALLYDSSDSKLEVYDSDSFTDEEEPPRQQETPQEEEPQVEEINPSSDNTVNQKSQTKLPDPLKITKRSKRIKRRREA